MRFVNKLYVQIDGEFKPATLDEVRESMLDALSARVRRGSCISKPRDVQALLAAKYSTLPHELFAVLFLDTRHRLIELREMFRGTIDGASVPPREVVRDALAVGAAAVILVHNHPSGVAEPSRADELITHRLRDALALVDIRVLDHFIVAGGEVVSLAARGVL